MSTDRVIAPSGPLARAVLGDLPYMDIPLEQGDEPIEVGVSSSPVPGETCVDGGLIQLPDRTLTPAGMSALVSDAELRIGDGSILRDVHHEGTTAPIETIALGSGAPGGLSLAQAVARARDVRLVHLRRRDFQSSMELARTTLALAGAGCVPKLDPTDLDAVSRHLHPSLLLALGSIDQDAVRADNLEWSFTSVGLRRSAWREHDRVLMTDGSTWSLRPRRLPSISVLLATKRPAAVAGALRQIARQDHPAVEVIVALHGVTDDASQATACLRENGMEGHVIEVDQSVPLGSVLNLAAEVASGELLSKWDDDDLYGEHHLTDLALALRHSGAEMVGKAAEFLYQEPENRTILRYRSGQERPSLELAGGTLTISRLAFDHVGGFPPTRRTVDHYIKQAFRARGLTVYRTHGFGFALVRHDRGHTWVPAAGHFDRNVEREWSGLPAVCGVMELE